MKQTYIGTGELCTYKDFISTDSLTEHWPTEQEQRQELETSLDILTEQADFWSMDILRHLAAILAADTKASYPLFFHLRDIIYTDPGKYILWRKE